MFDFVKKTALAATVAFAMVPAAASAATIDMIPTFSDIGFAGGGPFDLSDTNIENFRFDNGIFSGADARGATFGFEFIASEADRSQPTRVSVTLNRADQFKDFQIAWSGDKFLGNDDDQAFQPGVSFDLTTTFASIPKFLIVSYTGVKQGGDLDIQVAAVSAVPLPAGGLLLVGALGGLAALRRRKKAA